LPKGWARIAPDLAVEVVSPNETAYELDEKLGVYQKAGVPMICVINPNSRTVMIYRLDGSVSHLREDEARSGEDIIPGFRCPVREILPPSERPTTIETSPSGPNEPG
jgi:Uma2 family endonuclease